MPDTVSSVCGNADGVSKCGPRSVSFKDKMTGLTIKNWPYLGYNWDPVILILSLDPAQADATSVLTAYLSLVNFKIVLQSIDLTATVTGGKTKTKLMVCIP